MNSINSNIIDESSSKAFRPIYYLGCKTSFTASIKAAIDDVDPSGGRLVDLFGGTGAVSASLGRYREVTTVDVQEYSRVLCAAILNHRFLSQSAIRNTTKEVLESQTTKQILWCFQPLIAHEVDCINAAVSGQADALIDLIEAPPLVIRFESCLTSPSTRLNDATCKVLCRLYEAGLHQSKDTTVSRYFGGLYFSYKQAAMLDAILAVAESADAQNKDTLKAAALSTASQLVNTVGKQFAQPIQPRNKNGTVKTNLIKIVQRDRAQDVSTLFHSWLNKYAVLPKMIGQPQALRDDYLNALTKHSSSFSVIYADPPYTRDHYSRFYHVLETMCLRDNPTISKVMKNGSMVFSRGAYREERHQSNFCIRTTAPSAFEALFKIGHKQNLPIVISYSPHETNDGTHPRVVSMSRITDIARHYYSRVEVCSVDGVTHNMLNRSDLSLSKREHSEVLIKCFRN